MVLKQLVFCSSAGDPSGLVVRASDQYSEGLGLECQLDPGIFVWIYFSLSRQSKNRDPKSGHYPVKSTVRSMSTREQWLEKQRMVISRNNRILVFGEVFKTSLTSWNSFNIRFAILLTLCCTWRPSQKHVPRLLTNAHVQPAGSKVIEMCMRHTL